MKYFITGISGFVAFHYVDFLIKNYSDIEIIGLDINEPHFLKQFCHNKRFKFINLNLLKYHNVENLFNTESPDFIVHLASYSSVQNSWQNPLECFRNNTNIFLNIIEAVRKSDVKCRILSVGSSEEYGIVKKEDIPLKEDMILNPISPYAVARVAQENLAKIYVNAYGLDIVLTRSFNHFGPYQLDKFVVSSIAKQIVNIILNGKDTIKLGNVNIIRDFVDVRDVILAYDLLLTKGRTGEIYNVCSGKGYSILNIVNMMISHTGQNLKIEIDQNLIRPVDNPIIIGDNSKIIRETGWEISYSLEKSLKDMYQYWSDKNIIN